MIFFSFLVNTIMCCSLKLFGFAPIVGTLTALASQYFSLVPPLLIDSSTMRQADTFSPSIFFSIVLHCFIYYAEKNFNAMKTWGFFKFQTSGQQNYAAKKSANIFDADSVYFKYIIMVGLSTFAGLFLIGLIWECYITRQRKTQYTLANHNDPKGTSRRFHLIFLSASYLLEYHLG